MSLEEYQTQPGPLVKTIGRWHDLVRGCGVAIFETEDTEALNLALLPWTDLCDIDLVPVLDDEESAALGRAVVEDHGA